MQKELTISLDNELYTDLVNSIGEKNVSRFIESVMRSQLRMGSSEIYDVELPVAPKVHSPRLADCTLADRFKAEMLEEIGNGKI